MILSEQEGDFVKTTIQQREVTAEKAGTYVIAINLKDNASTMSTEVLQTVIIEYEGTSKDVTEEQEEPVPEEETNEENATEASEIDYTQPYVYYGDQD